jgi:hypothetical protein
MIGILLQVPDPANPGFTKKVLVAADVQIKAGETPVQFAQRKAATIVAAINAVLPGAASVGNPPNQPIINAFGVVVGYAPGIPNTFVTIKGVAVNPAMPKDPVISIVDPTGEQGGFTAKGPAGAPPPPPPPSSGSGKGSMSGTPGKFATGMDDGTAQSGTPGQSFVDFGYYDDAQGASSPIAVVNPFPGEPDSLILSDLASQLNGMGVPASFDPSTDTLSLDQLLSPDDTMLYESSDTGLSFTESFALVPEPSTAILLGLGAAGVALRRRRPAHPPARQ